MFDSKIRGLPVRSPVRKIGRSFSDLRVRPKLMLLHNLFFLVLAWAVYFSMVPLLESRVASARAREMDLVKSLFAIGWPIRDSSLLPSSYDFAEGTSVELSLPRSTVAKLDANPGTTQKDENHRDVLLRKDLGTGRYQRITVPNLAYDETVQRAKILLFVVLGLIYLAAILVLEFVIMPQFVYRPLRLMLDADDATRRGDREHELIADDQILDDEIGQIMRSRNSTVTELRTQEDDLARTLGKLEQLAQDLQLKNDMLETAKKNLADQDRLVSLGLLCASVAHELNTPLAVLHGSIEKLLETVPGQPTQDRLSRMLRVTQRLRKISESLLDFARTRKQGMEPVPIRSLIDEAWGLVGIDEKSTEVHFKNLVSDQERITGNPDQLMQVFVNLLRNALCAVSSGGTISVSAELADWDGRSMLLIRVDDNGPGIPADVLPNIFEAFVTTRLDSRGTGLGLTVSEGIVSQHGGAIRASNHPGGGARIEVSLPAAMSEVAS